MSEPLQLRDIHEPPPVSWWPPAPGWWLLLVAVICVVLGVLWWLRRRRARHHRRAALIEANHVLAEWHRSGDAEAYCAMANALLKRTAMVSYPSAPVARLSGKEWLAFLDEKLRRPRFQTAELAGFADPYQPAPDVDPPRLHEAVTYWIRSHRC